VVPQPAAGRPPAPTRSDLVTLLAKYRNRSPEEVSERLDSLELVWLLSQVEHHFNVVLDLDDERVASITSVTDAVEVLSAEVAAAAAGRRESVVRQTARDVGQ
jgi:hypothetical protein